MEGALELIREKYNVESVRKTDDKIEVFCGRYTDQLRYFMCGKEGCHCDKVDGWCNDGWEEQCARPIWEDFDKWLSENAIFTEQQLKLQCGVSDLGYLYIFVAQNTKRAKKE